MKLWTIQPIAVWREIQQVGVYRCDPRLSTMADCGEEYGWLISEMRERIGAPPQGVVYPVWAWYKVDGKRKKPDLRSERWGYGPGDEEYGSVSGLSDGQDYASFFRKLFICGN